MSDSEEAGSDCIDRASAPAPGVGVMDLRDVGVIERFRLSVVVPS